MHRLNTLLVLAIVSSFDCSLPMAQLLLLWQCANEPTKKFRPGEQGDGIYSPSKFRHSPTLAAIAVAIAPACAAVFLLAAQKREHSNGDASVRVRLRPLG